VSFLSISFGGLLLHSHEYKKTNSGIALDEFHHLSYETCARCEFLKNSHYNLFLHNQNSKLTPIVKEYSLFQFKEYLPINLIQLVGRAPPSTLV